MNCIINSIAYLSSILYKYMVDEPFWFAFDIITSALVFIPGACAGAVLRSFGFMRVGPATGNWAARMMSKINPVIARGWYPTCQSAQMGGYGVAIVKRRYSGALSSCYRGSAMC
ncbi:hypothetical protein DPSP01_010691 [Paraphaeosphaeria sporulosa]